MYSFSLWQVYAITVGLSLMGAYLSGRSITESGILGRPMILIVRSGVLISAFCLEWANYTLWALLLWPSAGQEILNFGWYIVWWSVIGITLGLLVAILMAIYRLRTFQGVGVGEWRKDWNYGNIQKWRTARFAPGVVEQYRAWLSTATFPRITFFLTMFLGPGFFLAFAVARKGDKHVAAKVW